MEILFSGLLAGRWRITSLLTVLVMALIMTLTGCFGGGKSRPVIKPSRPPAAVRPSGSPLTNAQGMGPWSFEVCGQISAATIDRFMAAGQGNIITIKSRTMDTGDYGMIVSKVHQYRAKVVLIAQGEDTRKMIRFVLQAQQDFGPRNILGVFLHPDEPDLVGGYDPAALDSLAASFRAAGVTVPLGINFAVAVGFPGFGIEMIKTRGVPQALDFIAVEGYHITAERWRLVMGPACREVLKMIPAHTKLAMVAAAWADYGQPDPTPAMVKAPYTWWTGDEFAEFAPRLIFWLNYRWSTDRCTSDCRVATDLLPQVRQAIKEMAAENGWN